MAEWAVAVRPLGREARQGQDVSYKTQDKNSA